MSLVFSTSVVLSACGGVSNEEQIKGEVIQGSASAQLEKVIEAKAMDPAEAPEYLAEMPPAPAMDPVVTPEESEEMPPAPAMPQA